MKKLPALPRTQTPPEQRRRLARWMDEWAAYQRLRDATEPQDAASGPARPMARRMPAQCDRQAADAPQVGQVRLMHPAVSGSAWGPVYVAIVAAQESGRFLVLPYGRFAEPALPGELRTRRSEPFLRVLQIGQAVAIPADLVARSWLITSLTPMDLQDSQDALATARAERKITRRLALRVGPPLWSVLDPRHEYVGEERERLRFLHGEQVNWLVRDESPPTWGGFATGSGSQDLGLAAEDRDKFNDTQ